MKLHKTYLKQFPPRRPKSGSEEGNDIQFLVGMTVSEYFTNFKAREHFVDSRIRVDEVSPINQPKQNDVYHHSRRFFREDRYSIILITRTL